ncbi:MAG: AAA family ATPase [Planctomycetota bacterium]|jgi:MoxR-like ATPase
MAIAEQHGTDINELRAEMPNIRQRINALRDHLARYFVGRREVLDLMVLCTLAHEPILLVGEPGTGKSDMVVKFAEALGVTGESYFEYMLTRFTEPSEIVGPIDIEELKAGKFIRKTEGKLPVAKIAFLDEIFKSNSAILNTLLTIINERKYYQDGKPKPVNLKMLFAATNDIPEQADLAALRDRFTIKAECAPMMRTHLDELIEKGLANEMYREFAVKPWANLASLEDFENANRYLSLVISGGTPISEDGIDLAADRKNFFPDEVYMVFERLLDALSRMIEITDRKAIKLYKLLRMRAWIFAGGTVRKEDLSLLAHIAERKSDFAPLKEEVSRILSFEG